MIICSIADDLIALIHKRFRHSLCVFYYLLCIISKRIVQYFAKGNGFCSNNMLKRSTLYSGENSHIKQMAHQSNIAFWIFLPERILEIFLHQDDATSRAAQCFMRGRCNEMTMFER